MTNDEEQPSEETQRIKNPDMYEVLERLREKHLVFYDQDKTFYLAIDKSGEKVMPVKSEEFKNWLAAYLRKEYKGFLPRRGYVEELVYQILSMSEESGVGERVLGVRLARTDNEDGTPKRLDYDLLDGQAVRVTGDGWSIVKSDVLFYRYPHQYKQVTPRQTDSYDLKKLHGFMNITDWSEWLVMQVYLISSFIPNFPKPLAIMTGAKGAGKTRALRTLCMLVDPSAFSNGMLIGNRTDEMMRICSKTAITFYDNTDKLTASMMSALCVISTGGTSVARALYTDNTDKVYRVMTPVVISSIPMVAERDDLLDRSLIFSVKRVTSEKLRGDNELNADFEKVKPEILGSIFNILSKTLREYPKLRDSIKTNERMADFYKLGCAIASCIEGYSADDFKLAMKDIQSKRLSHILDATPVAQAAQYLTSFTGEWSGTATEFYKLQTHQKEDDRNHEDMVLRLYGNKKWPTNVSALGKALERDRDVIESIDIELEHGGYKDGQRHISLKDKNWELKQIPF